MRRVVLAFLSSLLLLAAGLTVPAVASGATPPVDTPGAQDRAAAPYELLVGYKPNASASARADARGRASAQLLERVVRGDGAKAEVELVRFPAGASRDGMIRRLENDPNVLYAEPNWLVTIDATSNDPYYTGGNLWGTYGDATTPKNQYGSQAGEAWAAGNTGSKSVVVGVIDEGIDVNHPDLAANIWTNPFDQVDGLDNDGNGYVDDVNGWDFYRNDNSVYDGGNSDKHGTHVAGTIASVGGNGVGVAGVAWDATIISAKFLGPRGGYTSDAVAALDYLTNLKKSYGVNVVASNNSWGGGGFSATLKDAIDRAGDAGILFVAAAGNSSVNNDSSPHYPSSYTSSNIISVASITSTGAKSSFSNWGARSVDLGAPGSSIYSTLPGNSYGSYSGTSMATPHVTGGAVLAAASGVTGAADIKTAILNSAVATASMQNITLTGGRLDVSGFAGSGGTTNNAPVAADDNYSTNEDTLLTVSAPGVLGNDTDAEKTSLTAALVSGPANGTLSLSGDGSFTYTPNKNFFGADSFTYRASDGTASSNTASVTITVSPIDDAPIAANDAYATPADTNLAVTAPGVLGNDSDPDGQELTAVLLGSTNGSVTLNGDGSFTFTPEPGFTGPASFSYQATDGTSPSNTATVSITVSDASTSTSTASISFVTFGGKSNNNHLEVQVVITDDTDQPVSGAVVTADINGTPVTATTDASGVATMASYRNVRSGFSVTATVTEVVSTPPWDRTPTTDKYTK